MRTTVESILYVVCLASAGFEFSADVEPIAPEESAAPPALRRQNAISVHYVKGTHYEVGYSVGRTYSDMIKNFIRIYEPLQEEMLPLYNQEEGRKIYNESLEACNDYFPQYVSELKGMADGAGVQFHELFLMALDSTLAMNMGVTPKDKGPTGCSSLMINQETGQLLGHTEDALSETVDHYFIIAAHVLPSVNETGGTFAAREEKFEALTYAGHLPGYASGHNHHGLVFSINTIFVAKPIRGKIPREFITRALLASTTNMHEISDVLYNRGVGTADGFNVNMGLMNVPRNIRVFYSIEVTPNANKPRSDVFFMNFMPGQNSFHVNRLLRSPCPELLEDAYKSSLTRQARYEKLTKNRKAMNLDDLIKIFGNQDDEEYPIFSDSPDARVSTINFGIFDFDRKTWTMWSNNPTSSSPVLELPLTFTDLIDQININWYEENLPLYQKILKYFNL